MGQWLHGSQQNSMNFKAPVASEMSLAANLRAMVQAHMQLAHEDCFTGGRFGGFSLIFLSTAPLRLD